MINNKIPLLLTFIFLFSCAGYEKNKILKEDSRVYYSSTGFALIYDETLYKNKIVDKKINNDQMQLLLNTLKRNTPVKIINLKNSKSIELRVYKKANYPKIFTIVVSEKVASILELDLDDPHVEVTELKKNKTFIAKKTDTFDEEKKVADINPVNEVKMDDLTKIESKTKKKLNKKSNYILVISEFYYENSAINLMEDLVKKNKMNNISVKKINNKKYRLFAGPFENFNALKTTYISLNKLGFENLNIYKE